MQQFFNIANINIIQQIILLTCNPRQIYETVKSTGIYKTNFYSFINFIHTEIDIGGLPDLSSLGGGDLPDFNKLSLPTLPILQCSPSHQKDILFVAESPTNNRIANFEALRRFYVDLTTWLSGNMCYQYGFLLSDQKIVKIKSMTGTGHRSRLSTGIDNLNNQ